MQPKILAGLALGILLFSGFAYLWSSDASPAAVSYSRMPFASMEPSSPFMQSASLEPLKVRPGDSMLISAQVSDPSGVLQVSAAMGWGGSAFFISMLHYTGWWAHG